MLGRLGRRGHRLHGYAHDWLYEVKLDGYRALALKAGERVRLLSRNNKDLTGDFSHIATAVSRIKADAALLDCKIVAVDAIGVPRFQLLQHRSNTPTRQIVYYAFDLLHLDGQDLTRRPFEARRTALQRVTKDSEVFLSQFLPDGTEEIVCAASALGLEGIVAKRKLRYQPGCVRAPG